MGPCSRSGCTLLLLGTTILGKSDQEVGWWRRLRLRRRRILHLEPSAALVCRS
jgi:hypothetical protein